MIANCLSHVHILLVFGAALGSILNCFFFVIKSTNSWLSFLSKNKVQALIFVCFLY